MSFTCVCSQSNQMDSERSQRRTAKKQIERVPTHYNIIQHVLSFIDGYGHFSGKSRWIFTFFSQLLLFWVHLFTSHIHEYNQHATAKYLESHCISTTQLKSSIEKLFWRFLGVVLLPLLSLLLLLLLFAFWIYFPYGKSICDEFQCCFVRKKSHMIKSIKTSSSAENFYAMHSIQLKLRYYSVHFSCLFFPLFHCLTMRLLV